jgi:glycine cleavage system H protein
MVVLVVVLTFAVFVALDLIRERRRNAALLLEGESLHGAVENAEPTWIAGFKLPPFLSYHPGHTWIHWVGPDQAFVGIDDFARRLLGRGARIAPPARGTHVEQGESVVTAESGDARFSLLSPVSGEVIGVNPRLEDEPDLPYRDPYGNGWLYKIRSPRLFRDQANLLNGSLAQRWMEDTRERFLHRLMLATGSVIQDGAAFEEDFVHKMDPAAWRRMVNELLALHPSSKE